MTIADQASFSGNRVYLSDGAGSTGTITQTGGSLTADDWLVVGRGGGGTGTYNISGGTLHMPAFNGMGTEGDWLTVSENDATGTLEVSGTANVDLDGRGMIVGRNDNANGFLDIIGSGATISTTGFHVGANDGGVDTTANGTVSFFADAGGVTEIMASGNVVFGDAANLVVDLSAGIGLPGVIPLIDVGGTQSGIFSGLPEGAVVPGADGRTITYTFGDGNDIALVPEPASLMLLGLSGLLLTLTRRRQS